MSFFTILRLKQSRYLTRCLLEKYFKRYLIYQTRFYCNKCTNHRNSNDLNNCTAKTKPFKRRILEDIKHTREKVGIIIERENIWTIPNLLCVGRILTSPYLSYLILSQDYQVALWLLAIAGVSDLADGWIARTWTSQASKLGSLLDPIADKLLVGTLFLSLAWVELIPVPLTCLVITRDIALVAAASYIRYQSLPAPKTLTRYFDPTHATVQLAPTTTSKLNTAVQLAFAAGTVAAPVFHFVDHPVLQGLCYVTAITTLAGGLSYLLSRNTYKYLRKKKTSTRSSL